MSHSNHSNLLLASLSSEDKALIEPHLKPVMLVQHQVLYEVGDKIGDVYFPLSAVISLVVLLSTGEIVETAMVGRDGVVGASAALDGKIALTRTIVQLGGHAMTVNVNEMKSAALKSATLLSLLIRHEQTVYAQAQQSAACIASHDVEARLCRWMLRARDLSENDTLPLTQELLGEMLGVRRTSVSLVANTLQRAGFIKYSRGKIQILDIDGLRDSACECYETVKGHYESLLEPQLPQPMQRLLPPNKILVLSRMADRRQGPCGA